MGVLSTNVTSCLFLQDKMYANLYTDLMMSYHLTCNALPLSTAWELNTFVKKVGHHSFCT